MIRQTTIDKYVGKRYERLVVLEISGRDPKHRHHYFVKCKCDCGNEIKTRISGLQQGTTKSCGCFGKERRKIANTGNTYRRMRFGENSLRRLFSRYNKDAARRNLIFNLTQEQFTKLTKENCFYCGVKPASIYHSADGFGDYIYNGIDRIDSSLGYTTNNCVAACKRCNSLKNGVTKEMVYKIYHHIFLRK